MVGLIALSDLWPVFHREQVGLARARSLGLRPGAARPPSVWPPSRLVAFGDAALLQRAAPWLARARQLWVVLEQGQPEDVGWMSSRCPGLVSVTAGPQALAQALAAARQGAVELEPWWPLPREPLAATDWARWEPPDRRDLAQTLVSGVHVRDGQVFLRDGRGTLSLSNGARNDRALPPLAAMLPDGSAMICHDAPLSPRLVPEGELVPPPPAGYPLQVGVSGCGRLAWAGMRCVHELLGVARGEIVPWTMSSHQ